MRIPVHILAAELGMRRDDMKTAGKHRAGRPGLEWLEDLSGRTARITSLGASMVLVENHCGIRAFTPDCITLATRSGCVEVCGRELCLSQVRTDALMIRGRIASIRLPCHEDAVHEP